VKRQWDHVREKSFGDDLDPASERVRSAALDDAAFAIDAGPPHRRPVDVVEDVGDAFDSAAHAPARKELVRIVAHARTPPLSET
jgi:hypothetical protein